MSQDLSSNTFGKSRALNVVGMDLAMTTGVSEQVGFVISNLATSAQATSSKNLLDNAGAAALATMNAALLVGGTVTTFNTIDLARDAYTADIAGTPTATSIASTDVDIAAANNAAIEAAELVVSTDGIAAAAATALTLAETDSAANLKTREFRVIYSDSSVYTTAYSAHNGVFVKKFKIFNGNFTSQDAGFIDLSMETNYLSPATGDLMGHAAIRGSITGLKNGLNYGFSFADVNEGTIKATMGIGANASEFPEGRVIANGGPQKLEDDFKVIIKAVEGVPNSGKTTINLQGSTPEDKINHTTGRYSDVKSIRLVITDMETLDFIVKDIPVPAARVSPIIEDKIVDYEIPVKESAFEYSLATVDTADAVSEYAQTTHVGAISSRASSVRNLQVDGSNNSGTEMSVNWAVPNYSGKPIVGYNVYYQKQTEKREDWTNADVSGHDISNNSIWMWNLSKATHGATVLAGGELKAKLTGLENAARYCVWVRAYHGETDATTGKVVEGNIGIKDQNAAPTGVGADGRWAGFFDDISRTSVSTDEYNSFQFSE